MKKIVVCLTGVVNRSIKYTWDSIKDNIIDELRKEYDVDIAVFNNNVENCLVDGVKLNNNDMTIVPHNYLFEYKQTFIDSEIVKIKGYEKEFPPNFYNNLKKNGLRLMYIESKIAKFLEENKDIYEYVIVSNADYFYINKLPIECLNNISENIIGTCHHWENNDMCTDGFYIGYPKSIIKIMKRINNYYTIVINYKDPKSLNYERILNESIIYSKMTRKKIDIFFLKIRANLYLKNSSPEHEKYLKMFKDFLDKNKDKNESYSFLIKNIIY
jgi:hypothetical protein